MQHRIIKGAGRRVMLVVGPWQLAMVPMNLGEAAEKQAARTTVRWLLARGLTSFRIGSGCSVYVRLRPEAELPELDIEELADDLQAGLVATGQARSAHAS